MKKINCLILVGIMLITFCPQAFSQYTDDYTEENTEENTEEYTEESLEQPIETPVLQTTNAYPIAEIDRPLALPKMTLEAKGEMDIDILSSANWVSLRAGAGIGIIDNVEAGMSFPLSLAPEGKLGDLQMYGLYELDPLLEGKLHAAGRLSMDISLSDHHPHSAIFAFGMLADAPVKYKFHEKIAAIGGLGMGFATLKNDGPSYFLLHFDFGAMVQPIEQLAISLQMGIHGFIGDNGDVWVPLSLRGQYTVMGNLDLYADLGFIDLNNIGGDWVQFLFGASFRLGV